MPIITISRGLFSSGRVLAEQVAAKLGYRSMSREVLLEASTRYDIPEARFADLLETSPEATPLRPEQVRFYRVVMQAALCEAVREGQVVYHGHGGQELLAGVQHVLKVRLLAPLAYRVARVQEQRKMDQASAYLYIARVDAIRAHRVREFFGVDWQDPRRYDLLLNLGKMALEAAVDRVVEWAKQPEFQPTPASEQALHDLALKARIEAALAVDPETHAVALNVLAKQGIVYLWGALSGFGMEREVMRVIEGVPGVQEVIPDLRVVPEQVRVGEVH